MLYKYIYEKLSAGYRDKKSITLFDTDYEERAINKMYFRA